MTNRTVLVFLCAALLCVSGTAIAQVLYGSLTGTVTDSSGAVIPGAKVEAVNTGTGVVRSATSDDRGVYLFSALSPGTYKVTVSASSFRTVVQDGTPVEANSVRRFDATLQVGQVAEAIEVTAAATTLQTDRTDVNVTLAPTELANLPAISSAGRNYQALYKLVPGFSLVTEGNSSDGGNPQRAMSGFVNGTSRQNNLTRIDGAANTYAWLPTNTAYVPPTESIQEVNIVTNSFDAEQGNAVGAAVNVVTKSGTNEFHGSGFWHHTDNALKAVPRFNTPGARKPKYIMNQYGGSIGGPIKRNKLFFFADWEATKRRQLASRTVTAINPAGIFDSAGNANLSAILPAGANCSATAVAGCLFDPNTGNANGTGRTPFAGNIIPAARIDPAAKIMLGRIETKNFQNATGVTAVNNYLTSGSAQLNRNTYDTKVNWVATEKMSIFGRYSISPTEYVDPPTLGAAMGGASGGGQVGTAPSRIQNVGIGGSYTISPTMIVDANGAFTRLRLGATYAPDLDLGNFGVNELKIPGTNGDNYLAGGTPAFQFTQGGWNGLGNTDTGNPFLFRDNQYVMNANMSWSKSRHNVRFGIEHTRNGINHFQPQGGAFQTPRGSFQFNGNITALGGGPAANKANSLADFLLGFPSQVGKAVQNANPNSLRWKTWSMYLRDSWAITPKLTLNYGLRWEYYPMATADHGGVKLFDPKTGNTLIGGYGSTPLDNGVDVGAGKFLPRLGAAYRLGQKTVIRVGYGMSADSNNWRFFRNNYPATTNSADTAASFVPAGTTITYYPAASLTGRTLSAYPYLRAGIPSVAIPSISSGVIPVPSGVNPGNTIPFNFNRGHIHSYNFTIQRDFGKRLVSEIAYVGNRGVRLLTNENINAAPIGGGEAGRLLFPVANRNWGNVNCFCPDGPSHYNSLQTKTTWRMHGASAIGFVYTFSKATNWTDNEEESTFFGGQGGFLYWPHPAYKHRNNAVATYDRPHNISFYGVYELPFGPKQRWAKSGIVGALAGGWQVNWLISRLSGTPFSIVGGGAGLNAPGNFQTADQIGPVDIIGGIGPLPGGTCAATDLTCHYFNPAAFAAVPSTQVRFGNSGRNIVRGPGFFNLDASIFRDFRITERVKFQIRMEMFGATNTPHYNNPGLDVTNPATFGVITSTLNTAGRGSGTGGERQVWFAGRLTF